MSFTLEVKKELCGEELSRRQEKILLYGFCYCLKNNEFFTESESIKNFIKNISGAKTVITAVNRRGRNGFLFNFGSYCSKIQNTAIDSKYLDGRDESTGIFLRGAFFPPHANQSQPLGNTSQCPPMQFSTDTICMDPVD